MSYLDIKKSVMVSSPAGSGKTEKLARRYIMLLRNGVDVERILAVTFTDKAAAEMKQRILKILKDEDEKLFQYLLERMPLMRVSTIHSFCGKLLRRFSFDADIDPNYSISDEGDAGLEWNEILYDVLMESGGKRQKKENEFILQTLSEKGFRGLNYLKDTMDYLFQKRPFSLEAESFIHKPSVSDELIEELRSWEGAEDAIDNYKKIFIKGSQKEIMSIKDSFLTTNGTARIKTPSALKGIADYQEWAGKMSLYWRDIGLKEFSERSWRIWTIFNACLKKYIARKKAKGVLDYSDLEYLTYKMLTENPEWSNILYAFDERTDHILVDEFQDTNNFQWGIIDKLTEEWRSGMGAKRESGARPTIFFVGDEKQSIYFFRGANVENFHRAKELMETWLGDEFLYEEAKENYRSRPAIIDFTNLVFSKVMRRSGNYPWITRYSPFTAHRPGIPYSGQIEVILLHPKDNAKMDERKQKEAGIIARRIKSLVGNFEFAERGSEQKRFCRYSDVAILLKKRTHLAPYEEALWQYDIPFVAVKGIGFYQEPEVAMLRALVYFLSNQRDDYSLYMLLKSQLFSIAESDILQLADIEGESLFVKMKGVVSGSNSLNSSVNLLKGWLALLPYTPISELIEHALVTSKAWRYFHGEQKRANIKKFIRIVEDLETNGKSLVKIRDFLERTMDEEEAKANVNTEGMNAVKIMTIHAAKGLEFPIVIVPGIEEQFSSKTGDNLICERDGKFFFKSIPESSIRKQDDDFQIHEAKEVEEQKRLFYVAVTRAEEALILTGNWDTRENSFLGFLKQSLGIEKAESGYRVSVPEAAAIQGLSILSEKEVKAMFEKTPGFRSFAEMEKAKPAHFIPIDIVKTLEWRAVTETVDIKRRHGKDWLKLGDVIHRLFEAVSNGIILEQGMPEKSARLLEAKGISREHINRFLLIIEKDVALLKEKGIWQNIIMPRANSFTELPFIFEAEEAVYSGRIDRIIKENNGYRIYDYKTFPVELKEIDYLLEEYSFQMDMYRKAVKNIFNTSHVKSFIVFSHIGEIREVV
jgi:ATP-dependent helicase/nuclease subunit A